VSCVGCAFSGGGAEGVGAWGRGSVGWGGCGGMGWLELRWGERGSEGFLLLVHDADLGSVFGHVMVLGTPGRVVGLVGWILLRVLCEGGASG
jgi:hypothetical protein